MHSSLCSRCVVVQGLFGYADLFPPEEFSMLPYRRDRAMTRRYMMAGNVDT